MVREAGAKEVYFLSTSPPIKYPCVYGIDMSTKKDMIAKHNSIEQIRKQLGADILLYQELDQLIAAASVGNKDIKNFCSACFDGRYPSGDVTEEMLIEIERERLDSKEQNLANYF